MLVEFEIVKSSWEGFIWSCVLATRTRFLRSADQALNHASIFLASGLDFEYWIITPYYALYICHFH